MEDFGDPPVEPALSILVNSLELQADLHPWGRFLMRVHSLDLLKTRLRLIHSYTFLSGEFVSTCHMPTYQAFLYAADFRPTYNWQKHFLQHLQSDCPNRRWVLKSPDHIFALEKLFAVFPEAVIIQTHRDPLEVLRSSSQLTQVLQGLFCRVASLDQLGIREARMLAEGIQRIMRFRDAHPELAMRFIDVTYEELVSDPLTIVRKIYQQFDIRLTEAAAERMQRMASSRSRYRGHNGSPTLAELGLNGPTDLRPFQSYCSRFRITCQQ